MVPLSTFASTDRHDSSLEAQTDSEEVTNKKNSYKEDPMLSVQTGIISKTSCKEITSPVSFNESLLYPFRKCFESEATFF